MLVAKAEVMKKAIITRDGTVEAASFSRDILMNDSNFFSFVQTQTYAKADRN